MNGYCDWCECGDRPLTAFKGGEICPECLEREQARRDAEAQRAEDALPRRERMALQRARDHNVD